MYNFERALAAAIIRQAFYDYKQIRKGRLKGVVSFEELDEFFRSDWIRCLAEMINIDCKLINKKREEIKNDKQREQASTSG